MSLDRLPKWKQLLMTEEGFAPIVAALSADLSTEDVDELLRFFESEKEPERRKAMQVLVDLRSSAQRDPRFSGPRKERLKQIASRYLREQYPLGSYGAPSRLILSFLAPEVVDEFLGNELQIRPDWPQQKIDYVLKDMSISGPRSLEHLRRLAEQKGVIGEKAIDSLRSVGYMSWEPVQKLGEKFRKERSSSVLSALYDSYIAFQVNKPIAPIIKLLGKPTKKIGNTYIYQTEGTMLTLGEDADGNLSEFKIA